MGFETAELLKLIVRKSPSGKKGGALLMIHKPHLVVLDLMCSIHRLSSFKGTIVELYNVLMEQVRIWLIDHKTPIVWVSIDKGVPVFKTRKTYNRPSDEKTPQPYPLHTSVDAYGRLIFCTPVYDHANGRVKFRVTGSSGTIEVSRLLCSERRLRWRIFDFFGTLAQGEAKNIPAGSKLVISYSLDKELSPVVVTSTDYKRGVAEYYNDLLEADWDMQWAITHLSLRSELPPRAASLVCSVDGDMLGILGYGVYHARRTYPDRAGPVYFYNMNQTANGRTIEMGDFVEGLLYEHDMTIAGFLLLLFVCGNDYVRKADLAPGIGPEYIWDAIVSIHRHPTKSDEEAPATAFEPNAAERKLGGAMHSFPPDKKGISRASPSPTAHILALCRVLGNSRQFFEVVSYIYSLCAAQKTRKTPGAAKISKTDIDNQMAKYESKLVVRHRAAEQDKGEVPMDTDEDRLQAEEAEVSASDRRVVIEKCRLLISAAIRQWMGCAEL